MGNQYELPSLDEVAEKLPEIIRPGGEIFRLAKDLGEKKEISSTQLRKIYDALSDIREKSKKGRANIDVELVKFLTKIYYAAGRKNQPVPLKLHSFFEYYIQQILDENDQNKKVKYLEELHEITKALVAYHKFFENQSKKGKKEKENKTER